MTNPYTPGEVGRLSSPLQEWAVAGVLIPTGSIYKMQIVSIYAMYHLGMALYKDSLIPSFSVKYRTVIEYKKIQEV